MSFELQMEIFDPFVDDLLDGSTDGVSIGNSRVPTLVMLYLVFPFFFRVNATDSKIPLIPDRRLFG